MDHLRQSVGLRAYAQKNPKNEYKREAFEMFEVMLNEIEPEPYTGKVKVGIIGAGNFASTTILPILKELKKDCQILGIASSGGLSSEVLIKNYKIKNKC